MVLSFKDFEQRQKGSPVQQFIAGNQLIFVETLWTAQAVMFVAVILTVRHLLNSYFPDMRNISLIMTEAGIFLLLLILASFVKRYGAGHFRHIASLYPVIRVVRVLFYPIAKIPFPDGNPEKDTEASGNESGETGDYQAFDALQTTVDIDVKDILSSRMDVTAVDISLDFDTMYSIVVESGYSRLPVYEDEDRKSTRLNSSHAT
jgi:hypothetical protein